MSFRPARSLCSEMPTRARNPIVHLELHSVEGPGAGRFYEQLFGWRRERVATPHGSYLSLHAADALGAGIVQCLAERSLWLPYVQVDDVGLATALAGELGANVLLSPREGPAGWRSVIASRAGAEIALWQPKR
jgi:predicted enzyme related to lactoylglutathione lyase